MIYMYFQLSTSKCRRNSASEQMTQVPYYVPVKIFVAQIVVPLLLLEATTLASSLALQSVSERNIPQEKLKSFGENKLCQSSVKKACNKPRPK